MAATAVLQHAHALDPAALRRARLRRGLTQDDAGAVLGCTGATVSRYESGHIDPPASVVGALAGLYRVDISSLFTGGHR